MRAVTAASWAAGARDVEPLYLDEVASFLRALNAADAELDRSPVSLLGAWTWMLDGEAVEIVPRRRLVPGALAGCRRRARRPGLPSEGVDPRPAAPHQRTAHGLDRARRPDPGVGGARLRRAAGRPAAGGDRDRCSPRPPPTRSRRCRARTWRRRCASAATAPGRPRRRHAFRPDLTLARSWTDFIGRRAALEGRRGGVPGRRRRDSPIGAPSRDSKRGARDPISGTDDLPSGELTSRRGITRPTRRSRSARRSSGVKVWLTPLPPHLTG